VRHVYLGSIVASAPPRKRRRPHGHWLGWEK